MLKACWHCLGPLPRSMQELSEGQGAFSPGQSTQRLFIFRKCHPTDRRCSKMSTVPGSCCLQIGAVGAQVMTWINIKVGFLVAAKCLSTLQLGDSQTLTKMLLLILQQVLNWRHRSEILTRILKAAPGSYMQSWLLWKCSPVSSWSREQGWDRRQCSFPLGQLSLWLLEQLAHETYEARSVLALNPVPALNSSRNPVTSDSPHLLSTVCRFSRSLGQTTAGSAALGSWRSSNGSALFRVANSWLIGIN